MLLPISFVLRLVNRAGENLGAPSACFSEMVRAPDLSHQRLCLSLAPHARLTRSRGRSCRDYMFAQEFFHRAIKVELVFLIAEAVAFVWFDHVFYAEAPLS